MGIGNSFSSRISRTVLGAITILVVSFLALIGSLGATSAQAVALKQAPVSVPCGDGSFYVYGSADDWSTYFLRHYAADGSLISEATWTYADLSPWTGVPADDEINTLAYEGMTYTQDGKLYATLRNQTDDDIKLYELDLSTGLPISDGVVMENIFSGMGRITRGPLLRK